ncbi:MAG: hypothetical protein LLG16_02790, partial [Euryarchaeota archaeon]|nr:hypothetical protein [Euryarchaeota archaeon]
WMSAIMVSALMMLASLMVIPSVSATVPTPEWEPLADTGANFTRAMSVQIGDVVYIIGGTDNTTTWNPVNTTYSYDISSGDWDVLADMPIAVRDAAAVTDGDNIYVLGGADSNWHYIAKVQIYGIANDTWYQGTEMPFGAVECKAALWEGAIHVLGGFSSTHNYLALDQVYDPSTDSWSNGDPLPKARFGGAVAVVNGAMVYLGGISSYYASGDAFIKWPGSNWTVGNPSIENFTSAGVTVGADGLVYIVGGSDGDAYDHHFDRVLWYDIERDIWGRGEDLPEELNLPSAAATEDGRIVVLGGDNYTEPFVSVNALRIMTLNASVITSPVNSGEKVSVSIEVSFEYRTVTYFEGTARLIDPSDNVMVVQAFDSIDSSEIMFDIIVPEDAVTGAYTVNIERVRVHELNDRTFMQAVDDLAVNVVHVPSEQEQLDAMNEDLNDQLNDSNDRIDLLEDELATLNDDLDEKADANMMLIALVIALVGVVLAVVALVFARRK